MVRNSAIAAAYAGRAALFILLFREHLTPDTAEYSSGHSTIAWISSPITSLAGLVAGYQGVCVVGIVGAAALGWIVASYSHSVYRPLFLAASPPGWYTIQPSADAMGAASACVAWRHSDRRLLVFMVGLFHLEAALAIVGARIVRRYVPIRGDLLVIAAGGVACLIQWHIQVRYLLPGLAILASASARKTSYGMSLHHSIRHSITSLRTSE